MSKRIAIDVSNCTLAEVYEVIQGYFGFRSGQRGVTEREVRARPVTRESDAWVEYGSRDDKIILKWPKIFVNSEYIRTWNQQSLVKGVRSLVATSVEAPLQRNAGLEL